MNPYEFPDYADGGNNAIYAENMTEQQNEQAKQDYDNLHPDYKHNEQFDLSGYDSNEWIEVEIDEEVEGYTKITYYEDNYVSALHCLYVYDGKEVHIEHRGYGTTYFKYKGKFLDLPCNTTIKQLNQYLNLLAFI